MLAWVALIFLTLTGYSAGAVLGSQSRPGGNSVDASPTLSEIALLIVLWIGAIMSRLAGLEAWVAIVVWMLGAFIVAFLACRLRPRAGEAARLPM